MNEMDLSLEQAWALFQFLALTGVISFFWCVGVWWCLLRVGTAIVKRVFRSAPEVSP